MRSICLRRLWAWVALVFLAPKRSTKARLRARGLLAGARRRLLDHRLRVTAADEGDGAVVDVQGVAGDVVQEALVVGDDHRAAGVVGEKLLEPADGQDVEVVGRLVEQQDVDAADQDLRQQHPQLEPARQRAQRRVVDGGGDPQPLQHRGGPPLQRVAVVRGDLILEVRHPGGFGVVAAFGDASLFGERVPDHRVAAHREVEDDRAVVEEAILPQHADARALDQRDRALGRLLVAGEESHERALARAVGPHEAVPAPRVELQRYAGKQRAGAIFLGEGGGRDHAGWLRISVGHLSCASWLERRASGRCRRPRRARGTGCRGRSSRSGARTARSAGPRREVR
jgi:hypothetical protein